MSGLRQLRKERTRAAISAAAIALFVERGFDAVSVNEVAAAAEVSKPTLFTYFATKEDLVLHQISDHQGESARIAAAAPGSPAIALRDRFLDGLDHRDPVTGLTDDPQVVAYYAMLFGTPRLVARLFHFMVGEEEALARALGGTLADRLLAAHIMTVQRVLSDANRRELMAGRSITDLYPEAVRAAKDGFGGLPGAR